MNSVKTSRFQLVILFLLLNCSSTFVADSKLSAQDRSVPTQLEPKLDKQTLDASNAAIVQLDQEIRAAMDQWQVPGLSVAIVKDDQLLLSKGYGIKNIENDAQVDANTLFAIASNSKAFTAACLAILVDEGRLSWDDPVAKHLPWFRLKDPLASSDIRVRDLLCHRSGLGTFSGDLLWWGTSYSAKEVLERSALLEPTAPFRAQYGYSNLMFVAAGEVVSSVSGQSWPEFVQQRILKPLKMNRTITSVRDLVVQDNYATPHKTLPESSKPIEWMNWDSMGAAGGIISSANDMSQWLRLQLRQGAMTEKNSIFSANAAHEMHQSQMVIKLPLKPSPRFPSTHFRAYGLGWSLSDYKGVKVVGHGGGYDGMYSHVLMVPEQKLGVVVLTNSMTSLPNVLAFHVLDAFLGGASENWSSEPLAEFRKSRADFDAKIAKAITPAAKDTKPSHPIDDYAGTYRCPMYGDVVIEKVDDKLVMRFEPYPAMVAELEHLHYDTFVIRWRREFAWFGAGTTHFVADSRGRFSKIELDVPNEDLWFYELKLSRVNNQ